MEPIRAEGAAVRPTRRYRGVLSLTPNGRFRCSGTGNFHPPPWFRSDAAGALIGCRNVQIRRHGVARIIRLVLAIGQDNRVVRNFPDRGPAAANDECNSVAPSSCRPPRPPTSAIPECGFARSSPLWPWYKSPIADAIRDPWG